MELIKSAARRTKVSEIVYVLLNAAYAILLLALLIGFEGQPYLAYLLVILSKWRVFAVRPRFWIANLQTNLLDTLVGLSVVTLLWQNMDNLSYQLFLTVLFIGWLVLLKPLSKHFWVIVQGGVAQFIATMALFTVAHNFNVAIVTALGGLIGFVTARHIINVFSNEHEDVVMSVSWGVVVAELSWLTYYWTLAYTPLKIPQISLLVSLLGYMTLVVYDYFYHRAATRYIWRDLAMPILFSLAGILLILLFFNGFDPTKS